MIIILIARNCQYSKMKGHTAKIKLQVIKTKQKQSTLEPGLYQLFIFFTKEPRTDQLDSQFLHFTRFMLAAVISH